MSLRDDATTVAVLKALRDTVDAEYQAARRRVLAGLSSARDEFGLTSLRVTLSDQTPVATITLVDPKPAVAVVDGEAFAGWVAENYPSEVETQLRVRSRWEKRFISRLDVSHAPAADPGTGEVVPGLAVLATASRSFMLRPVPGGTEKITWAWRSGALDLRRMLAAGGGPATDVKEQLQ
jgi:hypothetical protein